MGSYLERLPSLESFFPGYQFLRIGEPEIRRQYLRIGEVLEAGQVSPDDGSDRIVPVAMPAQILLSLFSKIFEIRHRRN